MCYNVGGMDYAVLFSVIFISSSFFVGGVGWIRVFMLSCAGSYNIMG